MISLPSKDQTCFPDFVLPKTHLITLVISFCLVESGAHTIRILYSYLLLDVQITGNATITRVGKQSGHCCVTITAGRYEQIRTGQSQSHQNDVSLCVDTAWPDLNILRNMIFVNLIPATSKNMNLGSLAN